MTLSHGTKPRHCLNCLQFEIGNNAKCSEAMIVVVSAKFYGRGSRRMRSIKASEWLVISSFAEHASE